MSRKDNQAVASGGKRNPMVGARVPQDVIEGLDLMALRLRAAAPGEPQNRSTAIRTSFHIAETALRGDRLASLESLNCPTIADAIDKVIAAGLAALGKEEKKHGNVG